VLKYLLQDAIEFAYLYEGFIRDFFSLDSNARWWGFFLRYL